MKAKNKTLDISIIFGLIILSIFCYYGTDSTIQTGKAVFFLTETTKLKYYIYLYVFLFSFKFSFLFIPAIFARRDLKPYLLTIAVLVIFNAAIMASDNTKLDVFYYIEPENRALKTVEKIKEKSSI